MDHVQALLQRLDGIGVTLSRKGHALMLLALGSVGKETERADAYSDLDFFVIVEPGYKARFIDQLDWLSDTYPLAYSFQNTRDGHKVMFEDGIYGEFAVFEEQELEQAAYDEGRMVWKADTFHNEQLVKPHAPFPQVRGTSLDFAMNEALTNLYVGLGRYARGEKLSGSRFVQEHALHSILSVLHLLEEETNFFPDKFGMDRRLEARFPAFAKLLPDMLQGYERVPESALHVLSYIESRYAANPKLAAEIRQLASLCLTAE
ncbi:hypothetical protein [Marinicrinis sediminis]|uniref:Nucleotidyltransferase domain-containing protein n=1 Tax=Marinicrinis sediminis TaxID=1652465 RepID=A0ABW5R8V8_9BACL